MAHIAKRRILFVDPKGNAESERKVVEAGQDVGELEKLDKAELDRLYTQGHVEWVEPRPELKADKPEDKPAKK